MNDQEPVGSGPRTRAPRTCYVCNVELDDAGTPGGTSTSPTTLHLYDSFYNYVWWPLCRPHADEMYRVLRARVFELQKKLDPIEGLENAFRGLRDAL
jgi:hypothetical protein